MTTITLILLVLSGIAIALAAETFGIWAACRWWRIERGRSFFRCLGYVIVLALVGVPFLAGQKWHESIGGPLWFVILPVLFVLEVVTLVWLLKWLLETTKLKAFGVWLIGSLAGAIVAYPSAYAARAQLAEAYAISSGSMALALVGEHATVVCGDCGFEFLVGMTWLLDTDRHRARGAFDAHALCSNCGQKQRLNRQTPIQGADRILVDKTRPARRWDMVTYPLKVPSGTDPQQTEDVTYIHRLVGLPGEKIEIVGGEVFVDDRIARKAPTTVSDAWSRVCDTRHRSDAPDPLAHHWRGSADDSNWSRTSAGEWELENPNKRQCELSLTGPRDARLAYNAIEGNVRSNQHPLQRDYLLACEFEASDTVGDLQLEWRFGKRTAAVQITFAGGLELTGKRDDQVVATAVTRLKGDASRRRSIALAVRDGWAYVLDGNRFAAEAEIGPTNALEIRGEIEGELRPAELVIGSSARRLVIHRITVDADIYYRAADELTGGAPGLHAAGQPLVLTPDQCFVLGDNSASANDARFHGPVDWASVEGVARWCYWPPSRVRELE